MSTSASPSPQPGPSGPVNRHAPTPVERQRAQLEKLLKDPAKPAYVPTPPKEKTIRPPREMMKNVQGSSAGAGSGEFHVYKASRRREYERLKMMDEKSQKEAEVREFEEKKRQWDEQADVKTAKNRAKRQKKKAKAKGKVSEKSGDGGSATAVSSTGLSDVPLKKRRLVNGQELVFRRPGEDSEGEDEEEEAGPQLSAYVDGASSTGITDQSAVPAVDHRITIIEDD